MTREKLLVVAHKQRVTYVPPGSGGPFDGTWWWFCHERISDRLTGPGHRQPCSYGSGAEGTDESCLGGYPTAEMAVRGALFHRRLRHYQPGDDLSRWYHVAGGYWWRKE
jgi:hypothetical protein